MAKLSLSEVSKKFHVDRSTIYRAVMDVYHAPVMDNSI